jgi:hypothetical protein
MPNICLIFFTNIKVVSISLIFHEFWITVVNWFLCLSRLIFSFSQIFFPFVCFSIPVEVPKIQNKIGPPLGVIHLINSSVTLWIYPSLAFILISPYPTLLGPNFGEQKGFPEGH